MRDIKFRFWLKDDLEMINDYGVECIDINDIFSSLDDENILAMQFTGLKDKNGVDVYEGDIVDATLQEKSSPYHTSDHTGVVSYEEFEWAIETTTHDWPMASWSCVFQCEVIGNIHTTPELLEGE